MNSQNKIWIAIGVVAIVLIAWLALRPHPTKLSGALSCGDGTATCLPALELTGALLSTNPSLQIDAGSMTDLGTLKIGSSGSSVSQIINTTCDIPGNASVAATSTKNFDCAISGVQSGDKVYVTEQASSTLATQYVIKGATASTTNGFVTFSVLNLTGAAAVPSATPGFGSSTQVLIVR